MALMFDGPSLGGFVCPCTITSTELWKMGQVSPNDSVLFKPVTLGEPCCPVKRSNTRLSFVISGRFCRLCHGISAQYSCNLRHLTLNLPNKLAGRWLIFPATRRVLYAEAAFEECVLLDTKIQLLQKAAFEKVDVGKGLAAFKVGLLDDLKADLTANHCHLRCSFFGGQRLSTENRDAKYTTAPQTTWPGRSVRRVLMQAPTPKMPPTQAVLKVLPATTTYPGAQFRLAGDRCDLPCQGGCSPA